CTCRTCSWMPRCGAPAPGAPSSSGSTPSPTTSARHGCTGSPTRPTRPRCNCTTASRGARDSCSTGSCSSAGGAALLRAALLRSELEHLRGALEGLLRERGLLAELGAGRGHHLL